MLIGDGDSSAAEAIVDEFRAVTFVATETPDPAIEDAIRVTELVFSKR